MTTRLAGLPVLVCLTWGVPAFAQESLDFAFPVDCTYGVDCFIQNYVDHDPGPGRLDYACGRLSYDGHDGTDIRLPRVADIPDNILVLAAADGVVLRTRDGMADRVVHDLPPGAVDGREAGNGVVIDHGGGWETQYSHLRWGSLLVSPGDPVSRGQPIGAIGLSGYTEFPHVEFTARYEGTPVDPFVGPVDPTVDYACGGRRQTLWDDAAAARLAYLATAGLAAGFADRAPEQATAGIGGYDATSLPADGGALVFWADVMGAMQGDDQRITIVGPDGEIVHAVGGPLDTSYVSWFAFSGRRTPPGGWPPGLYRGHYTLTRDAEVVVEMVREIEIR